MQLVNLTKYWTHLPVFNEQAFTQAANIVLHYVRSNPPRLSDQKCIKYQQEIRPVCYSLALYVFRVIE